MRLRRGRRLRTILVAVAVAVLTVACRAADEVPTDPVQLEGVEDRQPPSADDPEDPSGAEDDPAAAGDEPAVVDGAAPTSTQLPVELGPAGTVVVEVTGDRPGIADLQLGSGWRERERDLDDDELELTLVRADGRGEAVVEVELDGEDIDVHVEVEEEDAAAGRIRLPDGGSVDAAVDGDVLVITAFTPGDGWRVTDREQDDDEFEVTLERDRVRWHLELEADEGRLELRIDVEATYRR